MTLVDRVVDAHGGLATWQRAEAVRLRLSSGGLAFASKGQPNALRALTATVWTAGQRVKVETPAWSYEFDPIPEPSGLFWAQADIAAFAANALWTYVTIPFLLPHLDVEEVGRRLLVRFPPGLRTHSPEQVLYVNDEGLIVRHDYTALDFGRWAKATQSVGEYRQFDGLVIATRRRVRPRTWPRKPLLVRIDVAEAEVI